MRLVSILDMRITHGRSVQPNTPCRAVVPAPPTREVREKEDSVIQFLLGILGLGTSCLAADRPPSSEKARSSPMRFEWHMEGPDEACGKTCQTWISAVGVITQNTAREFEGFASKSNVRGATLVLDSEGGSVIAGLALGRAIRRLDITTTVGKTIVLPSDDGKARAKLFPEASCESMCAFVLLGGTRRYVPPQARVLVHMIWLGDKHDRARQATYSAEELGLVQQDIGSIARYTMEMGGNIELLETALRVPPWKPMYILAADEVQRMRLTTLESSSGDDIARPAAPAPWNANALATVTPTRGASD
jgi:hypothetical protein